MEKRIVDQRINPLYDITDLQLLTPRWFNKKSISLQHHIFWLYKSTNHCTLRLSLLCQPFQCIRYKTETFDYEELVFIGRHCANHANGLATATRQLMIS